MGELTQTSRMGRVRLYVYSQTVFGRFDCMETVKHGGTHPNQPDGTAVENLDQDPVLLAIVSLVVVFRTRLH